jgi:ketosteroid isomerase-like protein
MPDNLFRTVCGFATVVFLTATLHATPPPSEVAKVWAMEESYWHYVQSNDLRGYLSQWHADFLGWPAVSAEPLRKDHIPDWIVAHTQKGETLKSYALERLAIQVTGKVATTTYRVRQTWVDARGTDRTSTIRVIHTWLRGDGADSWQIISGMSAPTDAHGH